MNIHFSITSSVSLPPLLNEKGKQNILPNNSIIYFSSCQEEYPDVYSQGEVVDCGFYSV